MLPTVEDMTKEMAFRVGQNTGFGHTVKFDFGDDGFMYIDAKNDPHFVNNEDLPADVTVGIKFADFCKISDGSKSPAAAFMAGRMKIKGNVGASWKLGAIIGPERASRNGTNGEN